MARSNTKAQVVKDANGRAYNRTAHLPAWRVMMQRWSDYLDTLRLGGEVIQVQGGVKLVLKAPKIAPRTI